MFLWQQRALLVCFICLVLFSNNANTRVDGAMKHLRGVVVALVNGKTEAEFHLLCRRNKSILQWLWFTDEKMQQHNPDIMLFHEPGFSSENKSYIQAQTPDLPIIWREIKFDGFAQLDDENDPNSFKMVRGECGRNRWSQHFKRGYKNMCRFWFMGFLEYVPEYDWMFRLDDDCEFEEDARFMLPDPFHHTKATKPVFLSSPSWLPLHRQGFDHISTDGDGDVVKGLGNLVREFAKTHNVSTPALASWHAPYTNAFFINLRWFKHKDHYRQFYDESGHSITAANSNSNITTMPGIVSASSSGESSTWDTVGVGQSEEIDGSLIDHSALVGHHHPRDIAAQGQLVRDFMKAVDESNCIYSNRWGDMPLWGAALALINEPVRFLNVSYYHWSHKIVVWSKSTSGTTPRADIPWMDVWADSHYVNEGFRPVRISNVDVDYK